MLSIIIPCLNEEHNIKNVIKDITKETSAKKISIEIIIIDDGSTDNTYGTAKILAKKTKNIRVIKHKKNLGFGAAFWTGVKNSRGNSLIMIPGDGECSISDILEGLRFTCEVDIVIPYVYNKINRSFIRRVISSIYTRIINFTFNTNLNYTNGTVIYKTSVIKNHKIKSTGFFFQTELLIRLIKSGYLYCEIPVFLQKRSTGVSKAISIRSLINLMSCYLRTVIGIYITKSFIKPLNNKSATSIRIKKFVLKNQG